jgi:hypothetical protein
MRLPMQVRGHGRQGHRSEPFQRQVEAAAIIQGSDGNFYSCRPLYSEGPITYYDCRKLGDDVVAPPDRPPGYCWTETSCRLITLWCQDRCIQDGREEVVRDWYYCGVCSPEFEF